MKYTSLTAAVLLGCLSAPALAQAEDKPAAPEEVQRPTRQVEADVQTRREVTLEEAKQWAPLLREIENGVFEIQADKIEIKRPEVVRGPFLGVNAQPLDIHTAKELGLSRSTGLLVNYVAGGGPAATVGLKKGDVLIKLNDQVLVNAEQFAVLIRSQEIGDTVTLHGLREGEAIQLEAVLGEADVTPLGPGGSDLDQEWRIQLNPLQGGPIGGPLRPKVQIAPDLWIVDGWGEPQRKMMGDKAVPEKIRETIKKLEQQMLQQRRDMDQRMQRLRQQLNLDIEQLRGDLQPPQGDAPAQRRMQASMAWSDGEHTIKIQNNNGVSNLVVKDREDKVLYDGPLPENGQVDGLNADVQQKLDQLLKNSRIEHRAAPKQKEPKQDKDKVKPIA